MPRPLAWAAVVVLGSMMGAPAHAQAPAKPEAGRFALSPEAVQQAIDRGVNFLKRQQRADGTWEEYLGQPRGMTALCTLALLNAGVSPKDESIQRALVALRRVTPDRTYATALQTMVFCRASPGADKLLIGRNVQALERWQIKDGPNRGGWSYPEGPGDSSNSQFAVLALYDAERAGARVAPRTWTLAETYWKNLQNPDGSWGYTRGFEQGTGSMTTAGIGCLVMTGDRLGEPDAAVEGTSIIPCRRAKHDDDPIQRGLQWLAQNFTVSANPGPRGGVWKLYYLYGLERVGRLTNQRFIGKTDWYREGAAHLLQIKGGPLADYWTGVGPTENNPRIATSFALLFLSKGRWPVLLSKVKHGAEEDWNAHRNDVNNLTRHVEAAWEMDLIWQVLDAEASSVDDLVQSPVLYYCGKNSPLPDGAEAQEALARKIRGYLDRGGFLFAEGYCGGAGFDQGFKKLVEMVFPEPEYRLRLLPPEHPIWRTEKPTPPQHVRPLYGIEFGCRTSVVYCPADTSDRNRPPLSALWELSKAGRDRKYPPSVQEQIDAGLTIGANVLAYATNRELKTKDQTAFVTPPDKGPVDKVRRGKLYVASLKHPGGCSAAPRALTNLLEATAQNVKMRVETSPREIAMTDPALFDHHLVFMHGRTAFQLTDAERKALKTYLERGGMLLADSICASPQFTDSFRREMQAMFPDKPLRPIPKDDPLLTSAYGGSDLATVTRLDPQARDKNEPMKALRRKVPPELEGIQFDDRWGVIFSRFDLSCALEKQNSVECQGYTRDDAARIGVNVVMYSLQQ